MAALTARIRIGNSDGQGGGSTFNAAPGKAWTALVAGVAGVIIRPEKFAPEFELYLGATGSAPTDASEGMPVSYGESQFVQIANLTGNTIWYRAQTQTSFTYSKDA